jgi:hypothetical protein
MLPKMHHLQNINQTYIEHMRNAMSYAFLSQKASLVFLIHALYPDVFVDDGSKTIRILQDKLSSQSSPEPKR